jgi:hypothetical protein
VLSVLHAPGLHRSHYNQDILNQPTEGPQEFGTRGDQNTTHDTADHEDTHENTSEHPERGDQRTNSYK